MTRDEWYSTTSRLTFAAVIAASMAALPFTFDDKGGASIAPKLVAAQTADGDTGTEADGNAGTAEGTAAQSDGTGTQQDGDGAAEEFVQDPTPDAGGSGSPGVSSGEKRFDLATVNTNTPAFQEYKAAAERNDPDAAARALANTALAEQAITPEIVEEVNEELDVRTSLTPEQISEAVRRDLPY